MDHNDNIDVSWKHTSLVFLTFLSETHSQNCAFQEELHKLGRDIKLCAGPDIYSGERNAYHNPVDLSLECDGELETDGHISFNPRSLIQDIQPQVQFEIPVNAEEAQAARVVAAELIRIADDLNQSLVSQAAERLRKNLVRQTSQQSWKTLLARSVEGLLRQVPGVHSQQVEMALTLSLVKAVCETAPPLLWGLYNALVQYFSQARPR
ncbi:BH3 interacting domain death agonist [Hoplias malabaricus]|uniref:BH3 interacting domain death agonist n=1 Tax=Hoplias malabaricus TaxID=27720 RepID=UPI0034634D7F